MITRRQKTVVSIVAWLPVLVLVAASVFYVIGQYHRVVDNASVLLVEELSQRLNREVKIGSATVTPFGVAILTDVEIAAEKELAQGKIVTAREVRVSYDPQALLFRNMGAQSVKEITIVNPVVNLVRRRNGTLNIQDLFKKPPGPPAKPFKGTVKVRGGVVVFKDYLAKTRPLPAMNRFTDIQGVMSAANYPTYSFYGLARGPRGRLDTANFVGEYNVKTKTADIDMKADGVSAAYFSDYAGLSKSLKVRGGKLRVIAGIRLAKSNGKTQMYLSGTTRISNGSAQLPIMRRPITNINGVAALQGQNVILSLTGNAAGSTMRITGTLSDFTNPKVNISVNAPNVDFSKLAGVFKLPAGVEQIQASGRGPAKARITGSIKNLNIATSAKIPRVTVQGYTVQNVDITGNYSKGVLSVPSAVFTWRGAKFAAGGTVSTRGKRKIAIKGRASGIDLAALPLPPDISATGIANARFVVTGTIASPEVKADVNVAKGTFRGIPIQTARARITYARGEVGLSAVEIVSRAAGRVTVKGVVTKQRLRLQVTGESVDLASAGKILGISNLSGTGYFSGSITGPIDHPTFTGVLEAFAVEYESYKIDYTKLDFSTDMKTATVKSAVVRMFPAELNLSGKAGGLGTTRISFSMSGQIERLTLDQLSLLLGRKIEADGTVYGTFEASGIYVSDAEAGESPLQSAQATAEFRLEDGSAFGYPITEASARLDLIDDRLQISEAVVKSQDAEAGVSGSVMLDSRAVDLAFSLTGFDLSRLHDRIAKYAIVGGTARAEGIVTGNITNPKVSASANIDNLIINYAKFDNAELKLNYENGSISDLTAVLARGNQSISIQANGYNVLTNCLTSATGKITNISIPDLWSIFTASPYLRSKRGAQVRESLAKIPKFTSGLLNGTFTMSGCLSEPMGSLEITGSDVGIDNRKIETVVLSAGASEGKINLNQLKATAGDTSVSATGWYEIAPRQINLDFSAFNLDLSHLRPMLGENTPGGMMSAEFSIEGDIKSPKIVGSIDVVKPTFAGLTFDTFRASRIEVMQDRIEFIDVFLATGSHQIVARGYVPWSWSTWSIPSDKPIQMVAEMKKQELSVLASFISSIEPGATSGSIEASLQIGGTLADPSLKGSINVEDGSIALKNFYNQFNNINIALSFDGDRITVDRFSTTSSLGGTLSIVPGGYIALGEGEAAQANLLLAADNFSVAERNALGMQEDVNLQLNAGLSITGDPMAPLMANADVGGVAGGIDIHDAHISFVAAEVPRSQVAFVPPINPTFNVSIKVGPDVVLSPPNMTLSVAGEGSITGTLAKPVVVIDPLTIEEGTIRLAISRLNVAPGGTIAIRYSPPEEPVVRVSLNAKTNVTAVNSLGQRERYEVTVAVSGTVTNLKIDLSSDPSGLTDEQMLAALGHVSGVFASGEAGLQNELGNILTAVGTSTIFAPVESLFVEQLGFEQFTVEYGLGQPLALYASRRLWGNFFISYYGFLTSDFTSPNDVAYLLGISYRFKRNYQATIFVDDQQNGSFQMQYTTAFW
jgi:translocation and assembly module TamB